MRDTSSPNANNNPDARTPALRFRGMWERFSDEIAAHFYDARDACLDTWERVAGEAKAGKQLAPKPPVAFPICPGQLNHLGRDFPQQVHAASLSDGLANVKNVKFRGAAE